MASRTFSASKVNRVIRSMIGSDPSSCDVREVWLTAVATRCAAARPDVAEAVVDVLGHQPDGRDHLSGLSIGEIGVCYEALLSMVDRDSRKNSGQFFTPDDAAHFMARHSRPFGEGMWLDPCCGVGNLSWHLAGVQDDPAAFIRGSLTLIDRDDTARSTAVAVIGTDWAADGDTEAIRELDRRSRTSDFLASGDTPPHDFVVMNPPYARAGSPGGFETEKCRDLFAYFLEKVAKGASGFIAVTPASYVASSKFQPLRDVLDRECTGGDVYVYDNVPDTLFRGYKFGSGNTSTTNFVRAAVTVCNPSERRWRITPIIRWQSRTRPDMLAQCGELLAERRLGPHGEWAKVLPDAGGLWDWLMEQPVTVGDLTVRSETPHRLDVSMTPRYFISATFRTLQRGSKETLYFRNREDRDRAALVLNSSIPYLWWRALDGGVTLPRRVLKTTPVPGNLAVDTTLITRLERSEASNLVTKLNAGKLNENVKHPQELVRDLNEHVLGERLQDLSLLYTNNMFPGDRAGGSDQ